MKVTNSTQNIPILALTCRKIFVPTVVLAIQAVGAAYFLFDGVDDLLSQTSHGFSKEILMECLVALALVSGVVIGALHVQSVTRELRRKERALSIASGALSDHVAMRFDDWGLTRGESEVALFALKGCDVSEIARLRDAAPGTVRSQLSQIYSKAGVSNQAMLVSLFIEDLLDIN